MSKNLQLRWFKKENCEPVLQSRFQPLLYTDDPIEDYKYSPGDWTEWQDITTVEDTPSVYKDNPQIPDSHNPILHEPTGKYVLSTYHNHNWERNAALTIDPDGVEDGWWAPGYAADSMASDHVDYMNENLIKESKKTKRKKRNA